MARTIARDTHTRAPTCSFVPCPHALPPSHVVYGLGPRYVSADKDTDTRHTHQYQDNGADTSAR